MIEEFKLLPTPHPNEVSFVVQVAVKDYLSKSVLEVGTSYKSSGIGVRGVNMADGYKDYVFAQTTVGEPGFIGLIFVKQRLPEEANASFRKHTYHGNHYWPPVLKLLEFFQDSSGIQQSGYNGAGEFITAASIYPREVFIPSVDEGTRFKVEEFQSDKEYKIKRWPTPQPASVSCRFLGVSVSFPECLHDDLEFDDMPTASLAATVGNAVVPYGAVPGQIFPRTNFKTRRWYVLSDQQRYENGLWQRVKVTVYPPLMPKTIYQ